MSETPMKKQALLIGINEYQILPGLKYARQDAEAVADSLKQNYCFSDNEVMVLTDARPGLFKPTSRYIIQDHLEKLANQDLDLFIFGFWGHGLFRNGKRYLCPLDVMSARAEHQGLPFDELQGLLANIKAKNTCLILDCCQTVHDRGEAETLTASDKATMENAARDIVLRRKEQIPDFQSNVAILNSCKEGQSAYEWDARQHGLFTAHLLDAMKKRSNSVMQIASYISSNIEKTALELGKEQTPFYKLEGDIVLPVETKSTPLVTGDVFISYRHCNADLVAPVEAELKRRGISYFIDRVGVNYSMDYSTVIARAIKACKILLVVWTREAGDSKDMLQEIKTAKDHNKSILPFKLGTFNITEHDGMHYQLSTLSRCEAIAPTPDSVTELVNRIQLLLDPSAPILPMPVATPKPNAVSPTRHSGMNLLESLLEQEENEKREKIDQLQAEVDFDYRNKDYEKVIPKLEEILALDSSLTAAQKLLVLCKSKIEKRRRQEAKEKESRRQDAEQRAEEQRRTEAERKHRKAELQTTAEPPQPIHKLSIPVFNVIGHREEEAKKHDLSFPRVKSGERKIIPINGVEFAFRWCPAGTFMIGSPTWEVGHYDNETQHRVTLTKGFWMMETQVTQKQWKAVMGNNPSHFIGDNLPVEQVSWFDCQEFCKRCSELGLSVQLPTDAQWEYACRAGSTTAYFWGNALNGDKANCDGRYPCGTATKGKNMQKTTPVGSYEANAWGLYDMHGNVWEWCQDWYRDYSSKLMTDPVGPPNGSSRVIRGGCWFGGAQGCRSAFRSGVDPGNRYYYLGFRVSGLITSPEK